MIVRVGRLPWRAKYSAASNKAISEPLSSMAPRPQTAPSAIAPPNGGCFQSPSVPAVTGTTSWCAISTMGASDGSLPGQVITSVRLASSTFCIAAWLSG